MRQLAGLILGCAACGNPSTPPPPQQATQEDPQIYFLNTSQGPQRVFQSARGGRLALSPSGRHLSGFHGTWKTRENWGSWGLLGDCVGGPLNPTEKDPEAILAFRATQSGEWVVRYSSLNPCGLRGEVVLHADRDRVDVSELYVGEVPWPDGGRAQVVELLRIQVREEAVERYRAADAAGRIVLLKRLGDDILAVEALEKLQTQFPQDSANIQRTLEELHLRAEQVESTP